MDADNTSARVAGIGTCGIWCDGLGRGDESRSCSIMVNGERMPLYISLSPRRSGFNSRHELRLNFSDLQKCFEISHSIPRRTPPMVSVPC